MDVIEVWAESKKQKEKQTKTNPRTTSKTKHKNFPMKSNNKTTPKMGSPLEQ